MSTANEKAFVLSCYKGGMRYNSATFTLGGIGWLYIFRSSELLLGYKKAIVVVNHSVGEGGNEGISN